MKNNKKNQLTTSEKVKKGFRYYAMTVLTFAMIM